MCDESPMFSFLAYSYQYHDELHCHFRVYKPRQLGRQGFFTSTPRTMIPNHLSNICRISFLLIPSFLILFSLSGSLLYWGWTKYDQCPFEPLLPRSLLNFGLLSSTSITAALILVRMKEVNSDVFKIFVCFSGHYFIFQNG